MIITFISDTHQHHKELDLPGGDILIHAGDIMTSGYDYEELKNFCKWFDNLNNYDLKVFIAGNHDRLFQMNHFIAMEIVNSYKWIDYLQDESLTSYNDGPNGEYPEENIKIYGSPWQPEFYDWAFNLPRNSKELKEKWDAIPNDIDILITHGPPFGILDTTIYNPQYHLGCELLTEAVNRIKPKIHVFGHIHTGYGYKFNGTTHFFNASVLNEKYNLAHKPFTIKWNKLTNTVEFL
jgi:Icc-related predicted phosphoesterase